MRPRCHLSPVVIDVDMLALINALSSIYPDEMNGHVISSSISGPA
jgi:hypothetical protein